MSSFLLWMHEAIESVSRHEQPEANEAAAGKTIMRHQQAVEASKRFMEQNFAENIHLKEIALHACISPYHFSRLFRQHTQTTPWQFLLQLRLSHAVQLLKETDLSISDIAYRCGFSRPDYFCAAFSKTYHQTPTALRKKKQR